MLWICALGVGALLSGLIDPTRLDLDARFARPSDSHWFGADELGRDLFARVVHGARHALVVTGGASLLAVALGTLLGVAAAWRGGWIDRTVAFVIDFLWAIPVAIAVILIVSALGVSTGSLIVGLGGINWVSSARILRAETARLRGSDSLRTARAFGFGSLRLFFVHVAPQLRPVIRTVVGLCAVETLALETGLAFLGLRLPPPTPTWGGILADGTAYLASAWWVVVVPSIVVVLTLASLRILTMHKDPTVRL